MTPGTTPHMTPQTAAFAHPAWCSPAHCTMDGNGWGYHVSAPVVTEATDTEQDVRVTLRLVNWTEAMVPDCDGYVFLRVDSTPDGGPTATVETSLRLDAAEDLVDELTALIMAARPTSRIRVRPRGSARTRAPRRTAHRRTTPGAQPRVYPNAG